MTKGTSPMASLLGSDLTFNQGSEILSRLARAGLSVEQAKRLLSDETVVAQWVKAFPTMVSDLKAESRWSQLRNAMGIPDKNIWSEFTEAHFPLGEKPAYEYDLEVVHFDRELDDAQLLAEFKERGLELPEPEDGMTYAAAHPNELMKYPVVVRLARPWVRQGGDEYVFCLNRCEAGRFLDGDYIYHRWLEFSRFLARRPRK